MLCLGLMSGTSADGVDAVLARFQGAPDRPEWQLLSHHHSPYPAALRDELVRFGQVEPRPAAALLDLAEAVTEQQAIAARGADLDQRASLIGCHGQTLWHRPPSSTRRGASWQLLQAPLLAQLLARPVVHDFRAADLALGGQGAPLVPKADAALIGPGDGWRGVLNLGGIANLTLIPPRWGPQKQESVLGWDCVPANSLIDLAIEQFSDGQQLFDRDGAMAAAGRCDNDVIQRWLQEPYFQLSPPKSTGRECFGQEDLRRRLHELGAVPTVDAVATLTGFTAAVGDLTKAPGIGHRRARAADTSLQTNHARASPRGAPPAARRRRRRLQLLAGSGTARARRILRCSRTTRLTARWAAAAYNR